MGIQAQRLIRPAARVAGFEPYSSPTPPHPITLWLNGNEGAVPPADLPSRIGNATNLLRNYPNLAKLEAELARRHGLEPSQVLVTAGADEALFRACVAMLGPQREMILPTPTFEMLERYARLADGHLIQPEWFGAPYPTDKVLKAVSERTAMIGVVSPNNPTGAVAAAEDVRRLASGARHALILVDLAYGEFAEDDLTDVALALPNTVVARSFSKAWGLAGARVGYALGPPDVIRWLRCAGNPYPVSGLSAAVASEWLTNGSCTMNAFVQRVRQERAELFTLLRCLGADPLPSQANFIFARFAAATATWDRLGQRGIAVRSFPNHPLLRDCLRITCPGEPAAFARLTDALRQVMRGNDDGTR